VADLLTVRTWSTAVMLGESPDERSPMTPSLATRTVDDFRMSPPCPECTVALLPVGGGRHAYWTCAWCGTTMPRH
jgi:hypothetical protein